jgi:hypothetical protein
MLVAAAPADARDITFRATHGAEMTLSVPGGWRARERNSVLVLERGNRRLLLLQCGLRRSQRDMTGRNMIPRETRRLAPGVYGRRNDVAVLVPGGSCLIVSGRGAADVAARLRPVLGPRTPVPPSDAAAERLARDARQRTLAMARAEGLALAIPHEADVRIESSFAWDLPGGYRYQLMRFGNVTGEVVRDAAGDHVRDEFPCWGGTSPAEQDDALEPRLELQEWNAPPSTASSWRVSYAPAEPQPDGSTRVRWTGFVADGEAVIAPDGRLRRVRIEDHGQVRGRTAWRTVEVVFTGFPAAITPVRPEPRCG